MLVAAGADPTSRGRTWHVPSNAPRTQVQALTDVLASVGRPAAAVSAAPAPMIAAVAWFVPMVRELRQLSYPWTAPYVLDDSAAREHFAMACADAQSAVPISDHICSTGCHPSAS